jgi:hypothetical protein
MPAMSKTAKTTDPAEAEAPKSRSRAKLALLALVPLVLAGGGYGGWSYFMVPEADAAHAPAPDPIKVSAVPTEIAAETSFTHSFALGSIIARECGRVPLRALKAASDAEATADGMLASLSWAAANRRIIELDDKNCRYFQTEVRSAEAKAARLAAEKDAAKGGHAVPAKH